MNIKENRVKISFIQNLKLKNYNIKFPYNPPKDYPELSKFSFSTDSKNLVYDSIRQLLINLKLDNENINTPKWNPFSDFINPEDQVLIKPNLVKDFHPLGLKGVLSQITHSVVLRPIIDYILLALGGKGRIIIADTPLEKASFKNLLRITKIKQLADFYKNFFNFNIEIYDLRTYMRKKSRGGRFTLEKIELPGPPGGFININLKNLSELNALDDLSPNYYTLADYGIERFNPRKQKYCETNRFHSKNKHIYRIPKIILDSNVIISVPKLKTHRMAGITINLKNMIGICDKIYLPHYRQGAPPIGDAVPKYPPMKDIIKKKLNLKVNNLIRDYFSYLSEIPILSHIIKPYYKLFLKKSKVKADWHGTWYGNDTLWRTILDLNKIVLYADKYGEIKKTRQRAYFSIVDGIIAQEGEGPMTGNPKHAGILICGYDPVAIDSFAAHIMGYNIKKLKIFIGINQLKDFCYLGESNLEKISIISNIKNPKNLNLNFELPNGYKELKRLDNLNES